jgi:hypothetical protein
MMSKKSKATITIPGTKVKLPQWAAYLAGGGVLAALFLMKGQPDEEKLSESSGWLAEEVAQRFAEERSAYAGSLEDINRRIDELNQGPEEIVTPTEPGKPARTKKTAQKPPVAPRVWGLPVPIDLEDVTLPEENIVDMARLISKEPGWVAAGERLTGAAEAYAAGTYGKAPASIDAPAPTPKPNIATTTARSSPTAARSERSIRAESARLQGQADRYLQSGFKPKTNKPITQKSKRSVATTERIQAKFDRQKRLRTGRVQRVTQRRVSRETIERKEREFVPPRWY